MLTSIMSRDFVFVLLADDKTAEKNRLQTLTVS